MSDLGLSTNPYSTDYAHAILFGLGAKLGNRVWPGTYSDAAKVRNRKANRVARASRRLNRQRAS